jgi:hypothetical protein
MECGPQKDTCSARGIEYGGWTFSVPVEAARSHVLGDVCWRVEDAIGTLSRPSCLRGRIVPNAKPASRPVWIENIWKEIVVGGSVSLSLQ